MKKLNIINGLLISCLVLFCFYDVYKEEKNLLKIENALITNYNNFNNQDLIEQNKRLNKLLNLKDSHLNAIAVKGSFINAYEEFIINKGKSDNVISGSAVINDKRLVGFVRNSQKKYATVELLENLNRKISIKVNNNYGFLEAKKNQLVITGIKETDMNINEKVYTSGLTDIPGNIYIGKIVSIIEKDETFDTEAYVEIDNNYEEYKYLLVVQKCS